MVDIVRQLENRILQGEMIGYEEAVRLAEAEDEVIFEAAGRIQRKASGNKVSLCSIMNTRSGKCPEDCKYCAQSAHYNTGIEEYPLIDADEVLKLARENEKQGVHRFAVVTSGRTLSSSEFDGVVAIIRRLKSETRLDICASLGFVTYEQAVQLKRAGLGLYHHNLETSRTYFEKICTTHTYDEKISTIRNVMKAGLPVCCGGIIGMGETMEDRIRMALEIRELGVRHIPINILNPIPGTPLAHIERITPQEALKSIALFRLILPEAEIRYAAGRAYLGDLQKKGFQSGVNGVMVGNYLTTVGNKIDEDCNMLEELGMEI